MKAITPDKNGKIVKKAITAKQAYKLMTELGLCFGDDGRTFYATDEEETEVWEFDSKRERDELLSMWKEEADSERGENNGNYILI